MNKSKQAKISACLSGLCFGATLCLSMSTPAFADVHDKHSSYKRRMASYVVPSKPKRSETTKLLNAIKISDIDLIIENNDPKIRKNSFLNTYIKEILNASSLTQNQLEWYIELINKIPGFEATYLLRQSKEVSNGELKTAELVLDVKRTKAKLIIDANNYGVKQTGKYQFAGFGQLLNPLGWNDSIILNGITTDKPKKLSIGTIGYMKRLTPFGTTLSLVASTMKNIPLATNSTIYRNTVYKAELEQYV